MENWRNQRWGYHRKVENILQGAMVVLVLAALVILAFAPEENAGAATGASSTASASRKAGSPLPNSSKQPAKNGN